MLPVGVPLTLSVHLRSTVVTASTDMRLRAWRMGPDADVAASIVLNPPTAPTPNGGGGSLFDSRLLRSGCRVVCERRDRSGGGDGYVTANPSGRAPVTAADYGGVSECRAALTSAVFCPTLAPGMLLAGSLDGAVSVWR